MGFDRKGVGLMYSYEFRISKYDICKRENHAYIGNDWTSISDVGRIYNDEILTMEEYLRVENSYLRFVQEVWMYLKCPVLKIEDLAVYNEEEYHRTSDNAQGDTLSSIDDILQITKHCLRENIWCRLNGQEMFIHFGYDYYIYIGSKANYTTVRSMATKYDLFVERLSSPHKTVECCYQTMHSPSEIEQVQILRFDSFGSHLHEIEGNLLCEVKRHASFIEELTNISCEKSMRKARKIKKGSTLIRILYRNQDVEIITQYEQILLQGDKTMYGLCCFYDDVAYDALIQKYIT